MRIIMKRDKAELYINELKKHESVGKFVSSLETMIGKFGATSLEADFNLLDEDGVSLIEAIAREIGDRSMTNQIGTYRRILANPGAAKIVQLPHLEGALTEWLLDDIIKGWIFRRDENGGLEAWVVNSIVMDNGFSRNGNEPRVIVHLSANEPELAKSDRNSSHGSESIYFWSASLPSTADYLMTSDGWLHETPELHEEYARMQKRFSEIHAQPNMQFRVKPGVYKKANPFGSSGSRDKLVIGKSHRCINDETLVRRNIRETSSRERWDELLSDNPKRNKLLKGPREIPDEAFNEMPTNFLHLIYDLEAHEYAWVKPEALTEYVYDKDKAELLVLPESHRELINILTSDADVLIEDVVEGKSGGTLILLEGKAGTGKTLLAEVYAEKMGRALYSVQAGQFGTTPDSVSKGIVRVYENAMRWKGYCVILIDEADVYIRERGADMEHNAVVAAMLIALERQTEMTFLATNRHDDVDEAIISRCIAIVHFDNPTKEASKQIWKIQAHVMGLELSDKVIDEIVDHHDNNGSQKASGRDIRALLKLAYRYHKQRNMEITTDLLKHLGAFKRL